LGHCDLTIDTTLYQACQALVRAFFRASGFDFENKDDIIPPFTDGMNGFVIEWLDNTNTVNQKSFPWSDTAPPFTATPGTIASSVYTWLKQGLQDQSRRQYRRMFGYNSTANNRVRRTFNLAGCKFDLCNTSSLKIQNSSQTQTTPGTTVPEDENTTTVNAVPLKGVAYYGAGTWTGLRPYSLTDSTQSAGSGTAAYPREISAYPEDGLMTMRQANSLYHLPTPQVYTNPPPGAQMQNVKSTGYVSLEPGAMKTDTLMFNWTGNLNQLLASIIINGQGTMDYSTGQFSKSKMGHFKLFAFEKKLNSTNDQIFMRFEVNQKLRAQCFLKTENMSLVQCDPKAVKNYVSTSSF